MLATILNIYDAVSAEEREQIDENWAKNVDPKSHKAYIKSLKDEDNRYKYSLVFAAKGDGSVVRIKIVYDLLQSVLLRSQTKDVDCAFLVLIAKKPLRLMAGLKTYKHQHYIGEIVIAPKVAKELEQSLTFSAAIPFIKKLVKVKTDVDSLCLSEKKFKAYCHFAPQPQHQIYFDWYVSEFGIDELNHNLVQLGKMGFDIDEFKKLKARYIANMA